MFVVSLVLFNTITLLRISQDLERNGIEPIPKKLSLLLDDEVLVFIELTLSQIYRIISHSTILVVSIILNMSRYHFINSVNVFLYVYLGGEEYSLRWIEHVKDLIESLNHSSQYFVELYYYFLHYLEIFSVYVQSMDGIGRYYEIFVEFIQSISNGFNQFAFRSSLHSNLMDEIHARGLLYELSASLLLTFIIYMIMTKFILRRFL